MGKLVSLALALSFAALPLACGDDASPPNGTSGSTGSGGSSGSGGTSGSGGSSGSSSGSSGKSGGSGMSGTAGMSGEAGAAGTTTGTGGAGGEAGSTAGGAGGEAGTPGGAGDTGMAGAAGAGAAPGITAQQLASCQVVCDNLPTDLCTDMAGCAVNICDPYAQFNADCDATIDALVSCEQTAPMDEFSCNSANRPEYTGGTMFTCLAELGALASCMP